MSIISYTLKTHSREDITDQFPELNDCIVHNKKPDIFRMVVGKRKDVFYIACCDHDDCGKITSTAEETVSAWNKWNPCKTFNK